MIRHVVLFKLSATDEATRAEHAAGLATRLESLVGVVAEVTRLSVARDVGVVASHWDVVLTSEHPDLEALAGYQSHPAHREVVAWVDTVVADRAVVDYEAP